MKLKSGLAAFYTTGQETDQTCSPAPAWGWRGG